MASPAAPALLHIVGYLTGASLYAMLLAMVFRTHGAGYRLTLVTAGLGVGWNVGELAAHVLDGVGLMVARDWVAASSYAALGFLAAVALHMAGGAAPNDEVTHDGARSNGGVPDGPELRRHASADSLPHRWMVPAAAYGCASAAAVTQLLAAGTGQPLPSSAALVLLTVGLAVLSVVLLVTNRRQPHGRRALWMTALALFAVSALHLGRFHGAAESESWTTELLGHHASIPLAFAILYQDYRFGFGDLFLKRALTLLALVTLVFAAWSLLQPWLLGAAPTSPAVSVLLALWIGTALVFPWLHRRISLFVDRVVLRRGDYADLVDGFSSALQACDSEARVIEQTCTLVGRALNTASVTSRIRGPSDDPRSRDVAIHTAEDPQHVVAIGHLAGGRELLSDDCSMLERVALLAARRIDALRLSDERYERMLREREISTLATEAELRALRAQVNPHFLFNALTTIGYLIQSAPTRALDTLMRLTMLLRSALRSEGEFTTLGHEHELLVSYLEIERERFEERLDASVDIPAALAEVSIPSLIVQPLVENAIKHGVAQARGGGRVAVQAALTLADQRTLRITVRNSGAPLRGRTPRPGGGIGLRNVERRLYCYYGDAAGLDLRREANGDTVAEITLPVGDRIVHDRLAPVREARG